MDFYKEFEPEEVKQMPHCYRRKNQHLPLPFAEACELLEEGAQCGENCELLKALNVDKAIRLDPTVFQIESNRQYSDVVRCGTGFDLVYHIRNTGQPVTLHFDYEAVEKAIPEKFAQFAVNIHMWKSNRKFLDDLRAEIETDSDEETDGEASGDKPDLA